ncbi:hypothetical protein [Pseudomonas sp. HY13-MNA-CIBAN-0226]|uniref:hypothetical protein n=1 Tax=Pseudomonas sp. HY13-MNA-CIBAN-0226 TaxID=3140473 RepID=UPI00331732D9
MIDEKVMPHNMETPIVHQFRNVTVYLKFDWDKPNDDSPVAAHVVEDGEIHGYGITVAELAGPWPDYHSALAETISVAEQWIDTQLSQDDS